MEINLIIRVKSQEHLERKFFSKRTVALIDTNSFNSSIRDIMSSLSCLKLAADPFFFPLTQYD